MGPKGGLGYTRPDLEPTSFDDLPLGGEWTTRRRTISDSEIALFAALAGDFSPLTIDTSRSGARLAPPAMLVATAIGLGSMDMPVPSVAEWEWLNWKFPRVVRAGDTIYARWTLTQKRPPVGGEDTAIAVWRVDVHTADGALCAEGEVGASVRRHPARASAPPAKPAPAAAASSRRQPAPPVPAAAAASTAVPASRGRRRRHRPTAAAGGTQPAAEAAVPAAETPAATPAAATPTPERSGGQRRRRRRRPAGSQTARNGETPSPPASSADGAAPAPLAAPPRSSAAEPSPANPLSRVIRRLRGT